MVRILSYFILGVALQIVTCPAPSKRGGRDGIIVGEGLDPPLTIWEGNVQIGVTRQKICHPEDGCAVRGNLPVGYRLYIGAYVAVKLYREIATGLPALAMTTPLVRCPRRGRVSRPVCGRRNASPTKRCAALVGEVIDRPQKAFRLSIWKQKRTRFCVSFLLLFLSINP